MSLISGGNYSFNSSIKQNNVYESFVVNTTPKEFSRINGPQEITIERAGFWCSFVLLAYEPSKNNNNVKITSNYILLDSLQNTKRCIVTKIDPLTSNTLKINCFQVVETGAGAVYTYIIRMSPVENIKPTINVTVGVENIILRINYSTLHADRIVSSFNYDSTFNNFIYRNLMKIYGYFTIRIINPDMTKSVLIFNGGNGGYPGIDISQTYCLLESLLDATISNTVYNLQILSFTITTPSGYMYDIILSNYDNPISIKLNIGSVLLGGAESVTFDIIRNINKDY